MTGMKRSLRLFDIVCLGLNAIVGSGIFLLPDDLFREMGGLSPLAFLICAVGLLPIALCYATAARNHDRTGGPYLYAGAAFGPRVGFAVGWMSYANSLFSFAAVSAAAAAYLARLVPALDASITLKLLAVVTIAGFSALNYRGARPGAWTVDAFTIAKFAVLLLLIAALIPQVGSVTVDTTLPHGVSGIGAAAFIALFAAQGFEVVGVSAGESQQPKRHVPIAVVSSMLAASVLYVVVQTALVGSFDKLGEVSDTPLADAAIRLFPVLGVVVAVGGLISSWGFVSGTAFGTPRYLFAAASDGHLPRALAAVHPRFHTPHRSILATASIAIVLTLLFDYRRLIGMSNVTVAVQYLATCLAVARMQRTEHRESYVMPGGLALPLLGALVSLWIFTEATREELAWAAGSLVVGYAGVWFTRSRQARAT